MSQDKPTTGAPANDPDAIKADIEATREQLGRTVDELTHRLDVPARTKEKIAETKAQTKAQAIEGVARTRDTAVETYRESPPAVIGGAAAAVSSLVGLVLWRRKRKRAKADPVARAARPTATRKRKARRTAKRTAKQLEAKRAAALKAAAKTAKKTRKAARASTRRTLRKVRR